MRLIESTLRAAVRPKVNLFYGIALAGALILMAGPLKGLVVVIGLMAIFLALINPIFGLGVVVFANTSFQVLGSAHITGAPLSVSKMFGAITLGAVILHMMFAGWKLSTSKIYKAIFGFLLVVLGWDFMVQNPETYYMEGTSRLIQMTLLLTVVGTIAGQSMRALDLTVWIFAGAVATTGIIGVMEHFLPQLAIEFEDERLAKGMIGGIIDRESLDGVVIKRITGGVGDANWLAYTIAMALPLLVYGWQCWEGFWPRFFVLSFGFLQLAALVLSYTRTGFLGLGAAGIYLLMRRMVPLKPLLLIITLAIPMGAIYMPPGFIDRMFSSKYLKDGSTPLRKLYVTKAAEFWWKQPVFGYGYKGFGIHFYEAMLTRWPEDYRLQAWAVEMKKSVEEGRELVSNIGAHNLELEILVEYGAVGFVFYFAIFVLAFRELSMAEKRGPPHLRVLAICVKAGLIAFLVCGLLGHAKYLKFLWLLLGLSIAVKRVALAGDTPVKTLMGSKFY